MWIKWPGYKIYQRIIGGWLVMKPLEWDLVNMSFCLEKKLNTEAFSHTYMPQSEYKVDGVWLLSKKQDSKSC